MRIVIFLILIFFLVLMIIETKGFFRILAALVLAYLLGMLIYLFNVI